MSIRHSSSCCYTKIYKKKSKFYPLFYFVKFERKQKHLHIKKIANNMNVSVSVTIRDAIATLLSSYCQKGDFVIT